MQINAQFPWPRKCNEECGSNGSLLGKKGVFMRIFNSLCIRAIFAFASTSAFAVAFYDSPTSTVKMQIDKDIVGYQELAEIASDLDRGFISACMQMTKLKDRGQYTLKQAFANCKFNVQSI